MAIGAAITGDFWWINNPGVVVDGVLYEVIRATVAALGVLGIAVGSAIAYRRQQITEAQEAHEANKLELERKKHADAVSHHREQTDLEAVSRLRDRFTTAASQLADDNLAVRIAGVAAMAGIADEWLRRSSPESEARQQVKEAQTVVDVLCGYLRLSPTASPEAPEHWDRPVRETIVRAITARLQEATPEEESWTQLDLDFTGTHFNGSYTFRDAKLTGRVTFDHAVFDGGEMNFANAVIGGSTSFEDCKFIGDAIFDACNFVDHVRFVGAHFQGGVVSFHDAEVGREGTLDFESARFGGHVTDVHDLDKVVDLYGGGDVDLNSMVIDGGRLAFNNARFMGGRVSFASNQVLGGADVDFARAQFLGSDVTIDQLSINGSTVSFDGASFAAGRVTFRDIEVSDGHLSFEDVRVMFKADQLVIGPWDGDPPTTWPVEHGS